MKPRIFGSGLLALLACLLFTGAGKAPKWGLSLHIEGDEGDGPRMVKPDVILGKTRYFRISPVLTHRNVDAFYTFPAEDGVSYGAALKVDRVGWDSIQQVAATDPGRLMRVLVNGRPVDTLQVDKPLSDDHWVIIWRGLVDADIAQMEKQFKRIQ